MKIQLILITFFLNSTAAANINCEETDLHQKTQAICLVKKLVTSGGNSEIDLQVKEYEKSGMTSSQEYKAFFLGGNRVQAGSNWTYLVGVDFYTIEKFRSLAVVVKTFPDRSPVVSEVLSKSRIESLVK